MKAKAKKFDKQFVCRESVLTDLFETNKELRCGFNLLASFVVVLIACFIGNYILNPEKIHYELDFLEFAFQTTSVAVFGWLVMHLTIIFIFYPINNMRIYLLYNYSHQSTLIKSIFIILYLVYICLLFVLCNHVLVTHNMATFAILTEMVRLIMKLHSYIIETTRVSNSLPDVHNKERIIKYPKLSQLLYFLFAPTLIYRSKYPRSPAIRWGFVAKNMTQVLFTSLCALFIIRPFLVSHYSRVGVEPIAIRDIFMTIAVAFPLGAMVFLCLFYGFLQCWSNAWAEVLRFGDRQFYTDWWTFKNFKDFYRQWNTIVQDWLYAYIYIPVFNTTRNKALSNCLVLIVSAIIHEYLMAVPMKCFCPIFIIIFGILGNVELLLNKSDAAKYFNFYNTLYFGLLFFGFAAELNLYSIEWYSRRNCPRVSDSLADFFIPRFPECVTFTV